jgi:hypothetical protein
VLLLALFVPWQRFTRRDKLNGHRYASDDFPSAKGVWQELSETIPDRVKGIVNNVKLLHKSAEDAKKDATLWASRSEGDEEREHEPAEEGITPGTTWRPQNADMRYSFHDAVHSLHSRKGITKDSPVLAG